MRRFKQISNILHVYHHKEAIQCYLIFKLNSFNGIYSGALQNDTSFQDTTQSNIIDSILCVQVHRLSQLILFYGIFPSQVHSASPGNTGEHPRGISSKRHHD